MALPPGEQAGVADRPVGRPGVDGVSESAVPVGCSVQAALVSVPAHRLAHITVAQFSQGATLGAVVLAAILGQAVDDVGVAPHQGHQCPARADGAKLVVVADEHQFGPGGLDPGGEGHQVGVLGHANLVQDHHRLVTEGEPVMVEAP